MNIWVDLANSPQVIFFDPIIRTLKLAGHEVRITARDYAQTCDLADDKKLKYDLVGEHGGTDSGWVSVILKNIQRAMLLSQWVKHQPRFDIALSHNSYSQILAARLASIPATTFMDYEHQPLNHFGFRLAKKVIVPDVFPDLLLKKFGASKKVSKYNGFKEQIYLSQFSPEPDSLEWLKIPVGKKIAIIRPPAPWTAYHRFKNTLFDRIIDRFTQNEEYIIIFLGRVQTQIENIKSSNIKNICIPPKTLDGLQAIWAADCVISGGGTMNREAAIMGTPAYSFYQGKTAAVDNRLVSLGRMMYIKNETDIEGVFQGVIKRQTRLENPTLLPEIISQITET